MDALVRGHKSEASRKFQTALNRRLRMRNAEGRCVAEDGVVGPRTIRAARYCNYLLGGDTDDVKTNAKRISPEVHKRVRYPGSRSDAEKARGKRRVQKHRAAKRKREVQAHESSAQRKAIVAAWKQAAANYRANPAAYHYLAGGVANTIILKPTPRNYRSDCSQFVAGGYHEADVESPAAPLAHQWAATSTIMNSPHVRITKNPKPGDLGMYGTPSATHHVEGYVGEEGCKFIGHGSPPIDSLTPGDPDFYVTFDFLN